MNELILPLGFAIGVPLVNMFVGPVSIWLWAVCALGWMVLTIKVIDKFAR